MKVAIVGGGTGGHIYPAIALADALKKVKPEVQVVFVGARGGMEEKLFPSSSERHFIFSSKWVGTQVWRKALLPFLFLRSFFEALQLSRQLKPNLVIGVGGYASFFFTLVSSFSTDCCIWEPNARPGRANLRLSVFVRRVFIVFEEAGLAFKNKKKIRRGFMPLRSEFVNVQPKRSHNPKKRLFIFGGSQGSRSINTAISSIVLNGKLDLNEVEIVHQIGARDYLTYGSQMESALKPEQRCNYKMKEYIRDMVEELTLADAVVCRAGAVSVHEVAACRTPAIFVPLSTSADDHQRLNALAMVEKGFGLCVDEKSETFFDELTEAINKILYDQVLISKIKESLEAQQVTDGALQMAQAILKGD